MSANKGGLTAREKNIIVMAMFGCLGLEFPDIDRFAISILHHRSIITHSVFLPILLLSLKNATSRFGAAGFMLGESVHLAADVLSPPIGFGMVWLPWPVKFSLGPLSPLWLFANAIIGLILAKIMLFRLEDRRPLQVYLMLAFTYGLSYALVHEKSVVPAMLFTVIFAASFWSAKWLLSKPWFEHLSQHLAPLRSASLNSDLH